MDQVGCPPEHRPGQDAGNDRRQTIPVPGICKWRRPGKLDRDAAPDGRPAAVIALCRAVLRRHDTRAGAWDAGAPRHKTPQLPDHQRRRIEGDRLRPGEAAGGQLAGPADRRGQRARSESYRHGDRNLHAHGAGTIQQWQPGRYACRYLFVWSDAVPDDFGRAAIHRRKLGDSRALAQNTTRRAFDEHGSSAGGNCEDLPGEKSFAPLFQLLASAWSAGRRLRKHCGVAMPGRGEGRCAERGGMEQQRLEPRQPGTSPGGDHLLRHSAAARSDSWLRLVQ